MASSQTTYLTETYDELNVHQNDKLNKIISSDEMIYFSGVVMRMKLFGAPKQRFLVITNRFIYYIHPKGCFLTKIAHRGETSSFLKRKINAEKIEALSLIFSPTSNMFKVHITAESSFSFNFNGKREKIIKAIERAYYETHGHFLTVCLYVENRSEIDNFETNLNKKSAEDSSQMSSESWEKDLVFKVEHNSLDPNLYQVIPSGQINNSFDESTIYCI